MTLARVNVSGNYKRELKKVPALFRKQIPFATANALTATARDAKKEITRQLPSVFDRPNPFTKRGIGTQGARKTRLESRVFIKDLQAEYLGIQVAGGVRTPKKRAILIPVDQSLLNQYGNLPRGKTRTLGRQKTVLSTVINGTAGLWRVTKKKPPKLLVKYVQQANYRPRLPFHRIAEGVGRRRMDRNFRVAMAKAMRTAR